MGNCNDHKNPLRHAGTSQQQRLLPMLDPASAPLADKQPLDWMVWGSRLAQNLNYYNAKNTVEGSMQPFFGADIAARLALVATHPAVSLPQFIKEQLAILTENDNLGKTALLRRTFTGLFQMVFGFLRQADQVLLQLQAFEARYPGQLTNIDFPLRLSSHIAQQLVPVCYSAIQYFKLAEAFTPTLIDDSAPLPLPPVFNQPLTYTANQVLTEGLSATWWKDYGSWNNLVNHAVTASAGDESIYAGASSASAAARIQQAAQHNFFTGMLGEVSASAAYLASEARIATTTLLSNWPYHQPHYALFLAWLQLMEDARKGINGLTARHLDFYYQRVLRLQPRSATPDYAFLSLELNKAVSTSAIGQGTRFLGPKDSSGNAMIYTADRETVLNKASVALLRNLYMHDDEKVDGTSQTGRVYASPVANSADGLGAKLTTELQEWHPFFVKQFEDGVLKAITMPKAEIGFAIASHYLRLREGERTIILRLDVSNENALVNKKVQVWLTTEKGWLNAGTATFASGKLANNTTTAAVLKVVIAADSPAIVPYSAKAHGHRFATSEPVLKLTLPNDDASSYGYTDWLNISLTKAELEVQVGDMTGSHNFKGLKTLQLHNDNGPLNPSKAFSPFGNEPTPGNALIIGSEELFYKPGAQVQLNLEWKDLPPTAGEIDFDYETNAPYISLPSTNGPYNPEVELETLEGGIWINKASALNLFPLSGTTPIPKAVFTNNGAVQANTCLQPTDSYPAYGPGVSKGFMRLKLKHDFGHRNYRNAHTYYLLEKGKGNMSVDPPQEPYNPVLQSIGLCYRATASYTASSIADPDTEALQWLHIAPFGDAQQHVTTSTDGSVYVLPQLVSAGSIGQAQGSLFIGLQGAIPGDVVSLLCQVMEGSEDPLANPPEEHVHWHYLKGNNWKELNKDAVNDGTDQLKRSGIIAITLPGDADNANTLLDPGYLWVRAAVTTLPEGVSKIMGIHANAIAVTRLLIANNAAANLVQPAGSIAKMEAPDGKVKKVNQPYASFGGRAVESGNEYYLRVSERLRHKDRAVTVWDYEHLVLQQFPEIYKAKCLNHTKLTGSGNSIDYNEVAPGWVTLITIPNLQQRNDADPLKPFTKAATLDAIADFLKARTSCHVQLVTAQPQFEEVRLSATVVLAEGYEDINYYGALLQQELTQYLSPWAFGGGTSLDFGGSLHKSVLIDFIEERPYVDYITDVKLYHKPGENATESGDVEAAVASTARSILVSAAASKHDFNVEPPAGFIEQTIPCQNKS